MLRLDADKYISMGETPAPDTVHVKRRHRCRILYYGPQRVCFMPSYTVQYVLQSCSRVFTTSFSRLLCTRAPVPSYNYIRRSNTPIVGIGLQSPNETMCNAPRSVCVRKTHTHSSPTYILGHLPCPRSVAIVVDSPNLCKPQAMQSRLKREGTYRHVRRP